MKLGSAFILLSVVTAHATVTYYSSYNATELSEDDVSAYETNNNTFYCVNAVEACNETEGRRIDGSCNNLNYPTAGAGHAMFDRYLDKSFVSTDDGYSVRLAANGSALPPPRQLRTRLLAEGRVPGQVFTQLMMLFFVFAATDIAAMSIHDTLNYVQERPYCCTDEGATDPMCFPLEVPADDPVHRFSGLRCMNMTWPISFQSEGCVDSTTSPDRMNFGTPFFDLSVIYGNDASTAVRQRNFTGGLLNYNITDSGYQWPYVNTTYSTNATLDGITGATGVNFIFGLFFWREHNRIAAELQEYNPCWTDEQLFTIAREINIATFAQIFYYEMLATLMGKDNLINSGVLSNSTTFRDVYDETEAPSLSIEALTSLRWVHTLQEGMLKLYDSSGDVVGEFPEVNLTLSTGALATAASNIQYFAQGSFRQPTGKIDNIVDPIVGNWGLGRLQFSTDLTTSDLAKTRLFGMAPYIDYLALCNSTTITDFDDLSDFIDSERLGLLQEMYTSVEDIDFMAGLWSEGLIDGGYVPPTFYCLVSKQLLKSVTTDRHWFERDTRPNAFTEDQLVEIRQATVARIMCDNADTVTEIQPSAFTVISDENPLTSCDSIPSIDLSLWLDDTCSE